MHKSKIRPQLLKELLGFYAGMSKMKIWFEVVGGFLLLFSFVLFFFFLKSNWQQTDRSLKVFCLREDLVMQLSLQDYQRCGVCWQT